MSIVAFLVPGKGNIALVSYSNKHLYASCHVARYDCRHVTAPRDPRLSRHRTRDRLYADAALRGFGGLVLDGDAEPDLPRTARSARGRAGDDGGRAAGRQAGAQASRADPRGPCRAAGLAGGADGADAIARSVAAPTGVRGRHAAG